MGEWRKTIYGEVAADFAEDRLRNLCDPEAGIQTGPFGSQLHQEDYIPVGTPIITVEHLGENRILHDGVPRVSDADRDRLSRYLLRMGDIVFSRVGSVDRRALVRSAEDGWMFSGRCLRVRPDPKKIDPGYLSYFFGLPAFKEHIRAIAVGATMPSLNTSLLSDVIIPYPQDIAKQRAIAYILGTLDDKIELNRQMNETLETMARALFKSWFVDFDPVRAKAEGRGPGLPKPLADLFPDSFEDSEIGMIPKGWYTGNVGNLCSNIYSGGTPSTQNSDYWDGDIPWLSSGETRAKFITDTERRITPAGVSNSSTRLAPILSTVIASAGQGNTRGQTSLLTIESYVNQSVVVLTANPSVSSHCHLFFDLERRYQEFRRVSDAHSSRGSLTTKLLAGLPAILPPGKLVQRFESLVMPEIERITKNLRESCILAALRDTLLPMLISGELPVEKAERFIGEDA